MSAVHFVPVARGDLAKYTLGGVPLNKCGAEAVSARARLCGIGTQEDAGDSLPMILALLMASSGIVGECANVALPRWSDVAEEARRLLVLTIRREGRVTRTAADVANLVNKPAVVESYRTLGNRWTIAESSRDGATELQRARAALEADQSQVNLLRDLASALDAPPSSRPWWRSKAVLAIITLAAIFVLGHVALLLRVLAKVHVADPMVLMYPIAGLSASALVGAVAVGVNALADAPRRRQKAD